MSQTVTQLHKRGTQPRYTLLHQQQKEPLKGSDITTEELYETEALPLQARERRRPQLSFHEIDASLKDDIQTLHNPFAWFTKFSWVMQALAYLFLFGGFLLGIYIYFVYPDPPLPEVFTKGERLTAAVISSVVGAIMFLASMIASNIIALTLQTERNTKITTILLQKLIEKD